MLVFAFDPECNRLGNTQSTRRKTGVTPSPWLEAPEEVRYDEVLSDDPPRYGRAKYGELRQREEQWNRLI
jgi:hypothetical protein